MQEIERQLQEIVPKISEVNLICGEIGKQDFLYEPEILTQITQEGKRVSRVVVRVYVNKEHKDVYSQLGIRDFTDSVYMKVKEIYENMFDEDDENDYDLDAIDDSAFGFDLDANNSIIGHFYIFLMTVFNLIEVKNDKTPIIDNKGQI